MRNFGFAGYDRVVSLGTNGKMSEISAAMGLTSLESLDEFIGINRRNYMQYKASLKDLPGIKLLAPDETELCNYQYIVLEIDEAVTRISRNQLLDLLWAENVIARRYFYPGCHRMEPYASLYPEMEQSLPVTERLTERVMQLPTGTAVDLDQIVTICSLLRLAVSNGAAISRRLSS
jgi:dTDP-4-amino-4,6-dideoxygalactose transaminase